MGTHQFACHIKFPSKYIIVSFDTVVGIYSGLTSVNLPEIEKEFGLSSKQSAVILLSNDIGGIILLPIVSFYGTHGRKPKWIGIGALICGMFWNSLIQSTVLNLRLTKILLIDDEYKSLEIVFDENFL